MKRMTIKTKGITTKANIVKQKPAEAFTTMTSCYRKVSITSETNDKKFVEEIKGKTHRTETGGVRTTPCNMALGNYTKKAKEVRKQTPESMSANKLKNLAE